MAVNHYPSIMFIMNTRVGGDGAEKIIDGLPFDGFITTDTIGYAGGLWILWNKEDAEISLLALTEQEIHAIVKVRALNLSWLFSTIYASPCLAKRRILWSNIEEVGRLHTFPWLMIGDFNEVLCGEDKFRGNQVNINWAIEFKACLDSCSFVNLGFTGPKYTWTNKRQLTDLILERIDQCFANLLWRVLYPEAAVTHLPRTYLDYHPVLIELRKPDSDRANRPFRFQSIWLLHPDFPRVVKEACSEGSSLHLATVDFTRKVKKWNFEVFGNLFARKRRVLARLSRTQRALANNPSESLIRLEKYLFNEYSSIILQEEEYRAFKSRINAVAFGDRNTSNFHVSSIVRRQRNKIRCLRNSVGEWIDNEEAVKKHILMGFEKLYSIETSMSSWQSPISEFSCCFLIEEESTWIGIEVVEEDVKNGLWSLKPFKAPRPDGLHTGFYQQFKHEVGNSVCKEVIAIFEHSEVPEYLNDTFVTLILKSFSQPFLTIASLFSTPSNQYCFIISLKSTLSLFSRNPPHNIIVVLRSKKILFLHLTTTFVHKITHNKAGIVVPCFSNLVGQEI